MKRSLEESNGTGLADGSDLGSSSSTSAMSSDPLIPSASNNRNDDAKDHVDAPGARWQPFYLFANRGVEQKYNQNCVTIKDLYCEEPENRIKQILVTNFMFDLGWFASELPHLQDVDALILHASWAVDRNFSLPTWMISKVENPEKFGTHYAKLSLVFYEKGLRVIIHSANNLPDDYKYRIQAAYVQDFPLKSETGQNYPTRFEDDLCEFLEHYHLEASAKKKMEEISAKCANYDFSSADVILIASVPGRFGEKKKWGVGKLREELYHAGLLDDYKSSGRLAVAVSSFGSMGRDAWLVDDYLRRMMLVQINRGRDGRDAYDIRSQADFIWPTLEWIKQSHQGYSSGTAMPCSERNLLDMDRNPNEVVRGFKNLLRIYDGSPLGRARNSPNLKCIFRYKPLPAKECVKDPQNPIEDAEINEMSWFWLTSSNFNQASMGQFYQGEVHITMKSYEIGVLFIPKRMTTIERIYSCTPRHRLLGMTYGDFKEVKYARFTTESRASYFNKDVAHVCFPVPYKLPPKDYDYDVDFPWVYDRHFRDPDCLGYVRIVAQPN